MKWFFFFFFFFEMPKWVVFYFKLIRGNKAFNAKLEGGVCVWGGGGGHFLKVYFIKTSSFY